MELSGDIRMILKIGGGLFWTLVYIVIIRRGIKDKSYGMPMVALGANISWEFIFSFVKPHDAPQLYINYCWFFFDAVIVWQFIKYGKKELTSLIEEKYFYALSAITLIISGLLVYFISAEFNDWDGKYAAFGQNFMMSVLFVFMLLLRKDMRGQSIYVALFKMIGTVLPSFLFYCKYPDSFLLNTLYLSILTFDIIYVVMIYKKEKELGKNPWVRY